MIVVVDNLGPVRHAEIDLGKRLIVFAGPNHSGKTHVAWTIYGLLKALSLAGGPTWLLAPGFGERLVHSGTAGIPKSEIVTDMPGMLAREAAKFGDDLGTYLVAPDELYRDVTIGLIVNDGEFTDLGDGAILEIRVEGDAAELLDIKPSNEPLVWLKLQGARGDRTIPLSVSTDGQIPGLTRLARQSLIKGIAAWARLQGTDALGLARAPAIFPTERTAINLFARELASARIGLVERFLQAASDPIRASETLSSTARRYAGPILDCMLIANDLDVLRRNQSRFAGLADDLETLLGGRIDVTEDGEIGFTLAEPGRPRVPFHISASVVKSLASLVFYFRHQAQAGATLVIDEPELNLHPDLQRKVTRFLAKAVNRGFRIILSTHSDYVLREFSNLVRLGAAGERGAEVATALGYDPESTLKPDLVGVWHFANGGAESLEITGDGFNLPSIEDAIMRQNMDTQEIEMAVGD